MAEYVERQALPTVSLAQIDVTSERWTRHLGSEKTDRPFTLRKTLEDVMWDQVGLVRNGPDLESALTTLATLRNRADHAQAAGAPASNPAWNATMDLLNLIEVGEMVAQSALARTESRGAHYRVDHPNADAAWLKNIRLTPRGAALDLHCEPVQFTRLSPPATLER
jgi:succinate dehydrogenase/fumarate reductase flavoprotein subunit